MNNNFEDHLNLGNDVHPLKLGSSFSNSQARETFHTIKYDFKPASVDTSKPGKLDVSSNYQVTVTVPHLDGSGVPNTVFKGPTRDYSKKDCLLIINRDTNEITLERLTCNVNVKKTRSENTSKTTGNLPVPQNNAVQSKMPTSSSMGFENNTQRQSSKTKVSTGSRKQAISFRPKHSPIQSSPSYPHKSPSNASASTSSNNSNTAPQWQPNNHLQTLPSIPIIGDDFEPLPSSKTANNSLPMSLTQPSASLGGQTMQNNSHNSHSEVGVLSSSDSSSSGSDSSGSDSGSDSDSDDQPTPVQKQPAPVFSNGAALLNEDLRLSDSNSSDDSD
ncbi:ell-associated factor Eaf [Culicoides brevitarsis]|uniref:ell-associated factor Eaf n=1 Tax=Culicoides brevitarsis TaxID=469753 RepID=UPI00307BD5E8